MSSRPEWHALFAPLPVDVVVKRKPLAALEGWEQLSVELSAGAAGQRHLLVVLEAGQPVAASDWVLHCGGEPLEYVHQSVGGRIQPDGSFLGTRWRSLAVAMPGAEDPQQREMVKSEPSADDAAKLLALVRELMRRAQPR